MQAVSTSKIITGAPARELIQRALAMGVRAIGSSLGPNGRGLMFDGGSGGPLFSASGLDIARRVTDESGAGSVALRILRDALWQVQRDLGDGTTRTACIAAGMYAQAAKYIASGMPPALLNRAIQQAQKEFPVIVDHERRDAATALDIARSVHADDAMARAVSDAFAQMPAKGAIDVQQSSEPGVRFERYAGYCLDVQPEVAGASVQEQGLRFEMDTVHVLVVNEVIAEFGPLARILEQFAMHAKSLVIVARGFEGAARATLSANRAALRMHVLGLIPAEVGIDAMHVLDDLCVATGATVVSEEMGTSMTNVRPSMLGRATRLVVEHGRAVFAGASGASGAVNTIDERRALLTAQAASTRYLALDREKLERRAARLGGDWGVLHVGAHTQWESEQHAESARAALAAMSAAAASGVVDGAGRAFSGIADSLAVLRASSVCEIRAAALDCIAAGCRTVPARLAANMQPGEQPGEQPDTPYRTVDPLSTTLAILQHAVSVAATLLTVEVLIC